MYPVYLWHCLRHYGYGVSLVTLYYSQYNLDCGRGQVSCGGGRCIWISDLCNGRRDCPDGRDEDNCRERNPYTKCKFPILLIWLFENQLA